MTRVEIEYNITPPVTDEMLDAINRAHAIYGIQMVKLTNAMDGLMVTYDASRLRSEDVDSALYRAGIAVRRKE